MTKSELIEAIRRERPEYTERDLQSRTVSELAALHDRVKAQPGLSTPPPAAQAPAAPAAPADPTAAGAALAAMVAPYLPAPTVDLEAALATARAELQAIVAAASIPQRVEVIHPDATTFDAGIQHEQFPQLMRLVSRRMNVWIYGAPGGGKTHACESVAAALDMRFGFMAMSSQTTRTMLTGYVDATGRTVMTPLREFVANGGVFLLDEADKASPAILADIHSLMSQRRLAVPEGHIDAHDDFILLVAANTAGLGGTHGHETAQKADTAFRSRFVFLQWRYDLKLERAIALSINPDAGDWIDWIVAVRAAIAAKPTEWRVAVDPRSTYQLAELVRDGDVFTRDEIVDMAVFKACDPGTRKAILDEHPMPALKPARAPKGGK